MIISKTPFRLSFFGGGSDYPAWFGKHDGAVLSTSIDKYCYISCRYLPPFFDHKFRIVYSNIENVVQIPDIKHPAVRAVLNYMHCAKGLEIHHDGDLPARSGLGSSSSFTVGLLHALYALVGKYISKHELATLAIHIEQNVIKEQVGSQDQIAAAYGGLNKIKFYRNGEFDVEPVIVPNNRKYELQNNLMLFFTGLQRNAPEIAKSKVANMDNKEKEISAMVSMVDEAIHIISNPGKSLHEFGELMDMAWRYKRELSDKITNEYIDELYDKAKGAGAIGGKITGAGGGGFMLFYVPRENQDNVREALKDLIHVPFRFEDGGAKIVLYQPNGLT